MQRILILLFFVFSSPLKAQIQSELYLDGKAYDKLQFEDSLSLASYLNDLQIQWINEGHFFSGIDSLKKTDTKTLVYLHKGESLRAELLKFNGFKLKNYLERKLKFYANNGFPFASLMLDSLAYDGEQINGKLFIQQGPEIFYDSAYFFNDLKTSHSYIYRLLDVVPGDLFSERDYRFIAQKVERSPFLRIEKPTDLSFRDNSAKTFLDIKEEASSTFQGVIGLQQVQNGRTTAVGSLALDIQNLFRTGKQFRFSWERFAEESQSLDIFYKHPFFLDSKISPSFGFNLLKQDTTFLSRVTSLGVHAYIAPRVEMYLGFEASNGTLLTTNIDVIQNSGLADFRRRIYSIKLSSGQASSLERYAEGFSWDIAASAGNKDIEQNSGLPDSYYDSLQIETNFYRFEASIFYQVKLFKRQSFFHSITSGFIQNDDLLRNELYRIGGLQSLRGFNEKEIFARNYMLSRSEFRSFFEERSYAYIFFDQLLYSTDTESDNPFGLGLGFALATSAGQFSFALAVGNSISQDISFATMKAHFGYISRF